MDVYMERDGPPAMISWPTVVSELDIAKLHLATLFNKPRKIVKYIKRGTPVDVYNKDGQTALYCAALLGRARLVKKILKLGGDPNARCREDGSTPVHATAYIGSTGCLKLLLAAGGDLRLTDDLHRTPLDWANLQENDYTRGKMRATLNELTPDWFLGLSELKVRPVKKAQRLFSLPCYAFCFKKSTSRQHQQMNDGDDEPLAFKLYYSAPVIRLPSLNEYRHLRLNTEIPSACWFCGKFSQFVQKVWIDKNLKVTVRELRSPIEEDAVPDLLIADLKSLATLHHPDILMLLAVSNSNREFTSLVFEHVPLGSLYCHFYLQGKCRTITAYCVIDIITQICNALEYIHASGYLHCFVNSHSIFLFANDRAKLGCCEYVVPIGADLADIQRYQHPRLRSENHLLGQYRWMDPGVLVNKVPASKSSDVYSICCVLWEMIYVEIPFKDYQENILKECLIEYNSSLPFINSDMPELWYDILKRGLEPDATLRTLELADIIAMMKESRMSYTVAEYGINSNEIGSNHSSPKMSTQAIHNLEIREDGAENKPSSSKSVKMQDKTDPSMSLAIPRPQSPNDGDGEVETVVIGKYHKLHLFGQASLI